MEMAFMQQGGLKDDGMKQDPISGNPIPNGSMAEEVRDDIPAQLSEGEYVVPADVVRYYGVKHFEDIRNKAKTGLQNMEKNGRIGGEPVPVGGPKAGPMMQQQMPQQQMANNLSQDEMNEIKSMVMNVGGFVEQPINVQQPTDPYQQQNTMYKQPMAMADGGFTPPPSYFEDIKPTTVSGSFSLSPAQQADKTVADVAKVENKVTLYGPNGEEVSVIFPSEEYNKYISQGYTTAKPVTPKDDDPRNPRSPFKDTENEGLKNWGKEVDWSDPLAYAKMQGAKIEAPGFGGRIAKGLGFAVAGIPGAVVGELLSTSPAMNSLANAKASKLIAKAQGITDFTEYDEIITDLRKKSSGLLGGKFSDFVTDNMAQSFFKTKTPEEWKSLTKPKVTPTPTPKEDDGPKSTRDQMKNVAQQKVDRDPTLTPSQKIQAKKQAEQEAKGQQAGKGYVGGTGFKKGGLATRRKTKGK